MYCALKRLGAQTCLAMRNLGKREPLLMLSLVIQRWSWFLFTNFNWLYRLMSAMSSSLLIFSTLVR